MANKNIRKLNFLIDLKYQALTGEIKSKRAKKNLLDKIDRLISTEFNLTKVERSDLNIDSFNKRYEKDLKKYFSREKLSHDPQKLVNILSNFRREGTITKYLVHEWDDSAFSGNGYQRFVNKINEEGKEILGEISKLNNLLYQLIFHFVFRKEPPKGYQGDEYKMEWGSEKLNIGWQYPREIIPRILEEEFEGRREKGPFSIRIPRQSRKGEMVSFYHYVMQFKNEIEFRGEEWTNKLAEFVARELGDHFSVTTKIKGSNIDFFTSTKAIKNCLRKITDNIKQYPNFKQVKFVVDFKRKNVIKIEITHVDSYCKKGILKNPKLNLLSRSEGGMFYFIRKELISIADFHVESKFKIEGKEQFCRLNYLNSHGKDFLEMGNIPDSKGFKYVFQIPMYE